MAQQRDIERYRRTPQRGKRGLRGLEGRVLWVRVAATHQVIVQLIAAATTTTDTGLTLT